jgi:hypothetical protein
MLRRATTAAVLVLLSAGLVNAQDLGTKTPLTVPSKKAGNVRAEQPQTPPEAASKAGLQDAAARNSTLR